MGERESGEIMYHYIKLLGPHDQLHAGVVNNDFTILDVRVSFGYLAAAFKKQAICKFSAHRELIQISELKELCVLNVGFVDRCNLLAVVLDCISKGCLSNPKRSLSSYNL